MTQTVDSKPWSIYIHMQPLNFQNVIEPPERIGRDEFLTQIIKRSKDEETPGLSLDDWLTTDVNALESVLKGLSQEGRIDRGSFRTYID